MKNQIVPIIIFLFSVSSLFAARERQANLCGVKVVIILIKRMKANSIQQPFTSLSPSLSFTASFNISPLSLSLFIIIIIIIFPFLSPFFPLNPRDYFIRALVCAQNTYRFFLSLSIFFLLLKTPSNCFQSIWRPLPKQCIENQIYWPIPQSVQGS